jgi:hypothetical protein
MRQIYTTAEKPLKVLIPSLMIALSTVAQSVSPQLFNDMDFGDLSGRSEPIQLE